ncbi:DNA-3-methyladenine glycosylase 2 family protein [Microvirga sp. W0021]|uniref:DNA-3-methyladenine glycosylase II n=1 Tax=Hohaiivirga grylli TaxID=3133970 RepID=A0ABV0BQA7_9HYPH
MAHSIQRIDTENDLKAGIEALSQQDPVIARLVAEGAIPQMRLREGGFSGLCWIITGQQLSTASANAIWQRLVSHLGEVSHEQFISSPEEDLRKLGLSQGKIKTMRAVAEAVIENRLPIEQLAQIEAQEAHNLMTAIHGIGPWTADLYLLSCIGHTDVFPAGDLALQEAYRIAYGYPHRPSAKEITELSLKWRPWRAVAARILWAYYRQVKARDGVMSTN